MNEFKWELFLDAISKNQIIPVIGNDLILVRKNNKIIPFYDYLTQQVSLQFKSDSGSLNFREFVLENREQQYFSNTIKNVFNDILEENILVTEHLCKLARISGFSFYISTTFDRVFEEILQNEQCRPNKKLHVIDYSYPVRKTIDLSELNEDINKIIVFKILGSLETKTCAITDEEILEYIFSVKQENPVSNILEDNIEGKNLLFLGCDFPNWLLRFFIRILTNERFVMSQTEKIIADNYAHKDAKLSLFLKHFRTQIIDLSRDKFNNPIKFINDLYDKWIIHCKENIPKKFQGTVFLSFSHKDVELVRPIKDELKANGIDVWYDEEELSSGDNYDRIIKENIRNCHLFIPFISKASISNPDNYAYRVEWDLAISRRKVRENDYDMNSFIHPVIIDVTRASDDRIPSVIRKLTIQKLNLKTLIETVKNELTLIIE